MKKQLANYFYHTRAERRGALVLLLVLILLFLLPLLYPFLVSREATDFTAFAEAAEQLTTKVESEVVVLQPFDPNTADRETLLALGLPERTVKAIVNYRLKGGSFNQKEDLQKIYTLRSEDYQRLAPYIQFTAQAEAAATPTSKSAPTYFPFDPNTVTEEQLVQLGIPKKVIRTMLNFRSKGGSFRKKEDLQKIYGLSTTTYLALSPYIRIPSKPAEQSPIVAQAQIIPTDIPTAFETYQPPIIDINAADATTWQQLRGIGPAYAKRIVKFRDKLGGFHSVEQLAETYGLPDSTFQSIRPSLRASPLLRLIPINRATAEELQAHPYLQWKHANAIVNYRAQHGSFVNVAALRPIYLLDEDVISKIEPYLDFK